MTSHKNKIKALPYFGGKSVHGVNGIGAWIASLLPTTDDPRYNHYSEPFAGMLGIMCHRAPLFNEWINDRDELIINWWRCIRDQPEELGYLLHTTPYSQAEYRRAYDELYTETDPLRRALNVAIVLYQGRCKSLARRYSWGRTSVKTEAWGKKDLLDERVWGLHARIQHALLFNEDAVKFMERTADFINAIVYCDPPYRSALTGDNYGHHELNIDAFSEVLSFHKGAIAISGYGNEWDHLGWEKHEYATFSMFQSAGDNKRTEVVWTNFTREESKTTLSLFDSMDM